MGFVKGQPVSVAKASVEYKRIWEMRECQSLWVYCYMYECPVLCITDGYLADSVGKKTLHDQN